MLAIQPSPIHGRGGFATQDIPCHTRIVEYRGQKIDKSQSIERCRQGNPFIFYLDDQFDLDGSGEENPARFLNHSCNPNCEALYIEGRIWIVACRDIRAGEELTFDYGYDLDDYRKYPCQCGSPRCRRYMYDAGFRV
jgi:hypothetical protein